MQQIIWAALFSVLLILLRIGLLWFDSDFFDPPYLGGVLLTFFAQFCVALPVAVLVFSGKSSFSRVFGWLIAVLLLLANLIAFHYETVFGRLPALSLLYYLNELNHLRSSLSANASLALVAAEAAVMVVLLWIVKRLLSRRGHGFSRTHTLVFGAGASFAGVLTILLYYHPGVLPSAMFWGSRDTVTWLLQSAFANTAYTGADFKLEKQQIWYYQKTLGQNVPAGGQNTTYPLCAPHPPAPVDSGNGRSVILLILESVGTQEMQQTVDGKPVMPKLREIAADNLYFDNFHAPGTKSNQAMPAIFSGLPAQTYINVLWEKPPLTMRGFPGVLGKSDYETAYFHGADLSFEHQRAFLQTVGFEQIFEYDPDLELPVYGWGYEDGAMFDRLRAWIERQRTAQPDGSYLATLFTLSTHDPFVLPEHWRPVFADSTPAPRSDADWSGLFDTVDYQGAALEAFAFLDFHLGQFYEWYRREEAPKGTLLILLGDHTPYTAAAGRARAPRHDVPLVIAGLSDAELAAYQGYRQRLAAAHDIPATLLRLLGLPPHHCNQGIDLLADQARWPNERVVYSVSGDNLENVYFRQNDASVVFDRLRGTFHVPARQGPEQPVTGAVQRLAETAKPLLDIMLPLNAYLVDNNAYFPADGARLFDRNALTGVVEPIFVSHRANTRGARDAKEENSLEALEQVAQAGFEWVEVDVQITRDGIPVLIHDPTIDVDGRSVVVQTLTLDEIRALPGYDTVLTLAQALERFGDTLNFLIEAKPQKHIAAQLALAREIAELARAKRGAKRIIVDSFDSSLIASIQTQCQCETAWDTPFREPVGDRQLQFAVTLGMQWIYVHQDAVDADLIERAHRHGLRVMTYTVNDFATLAAWEAQLPDGIITDDRVIPATWAQQRL